MKRQKISNLGIKKGVTNALKSITLADIGESILQPHKFDEFILGVQDASVVLFNANYIEMDAPQVDIDSLGFGERVFKGINSNGTSKNSDAKPTFKTNKLIAVEFGADFSIPDTVSRRNIARGRLEESIMSAFIQAASADIEDVCFNGDTTSLIETLKVTDGWLKKAGVKSTFEFNTNNEEAVIELFDLALEKLDKKYLVRDDYRFFVPYFVEDALRTSYSKRQTVGGDIALMEGGGLTYKGIKIIRVPVLDRGLEDNGNILLGNYDQMTYGIFLEVTIEPERKAKNRSTDFVATVEFDCNYVDENSAVAVALTVVSTPLLP